MKPTSGGGLLRMGLLALLWGSSFLWIKIALGGLSPLQITVVRCLLGAGVLVALCYASGQRLPSGRRVWARLTLAGFFASTLPFTLFAVGERTVDSGVAGVLNATTPLWALLIGIAIGSERGIRPVRLAGLLLGFAGTLLIFAPWQANGLFGPGALVMLAAAASYAVAYTYVGSRLSGSGSPLVLSAAQLLVACGLSAVAIPAAGVQAVSLTPAVVIAVVILGVFGTGFAFALNYRLIADEGATNATTVGYLLPVVSVLLGAAVLGEDLSLRVLCGMVIVLAGVGMTRAKPAHRAAPPPEPVRSRANPRSSAGAGRPTGG